MHVLIFELSLTGHHAAYLENAAETFLARGDTVTITLLERHASHRSVLALVARYPSACSIEPLPDSCFPRVLPGFLAGVKREMSIWRLLGSAYRRVSQRRQVDHVFLPYLDYCLHALALLGAPYRAPWSGIAMRPGFHLPVELGYVDQGLVTELKEALFFRLLNRSRLNRVLVIDPLLSRHVVAANPNCKVTLLRDPAEFQAPLNRVEAREHLGIQSGAYVVLVYGAIDERKALDRLVVALGDPKLSQVHVLVVGAVSATLKKFLFGPECSLLRKGARLTVRDGYATSELEAAAFAATDAVWVAYRDHLGMSGVLGLAAVADKPVIASRKGLIGWHTVDQRLGVTVDIEDAPDVRRAIGLLTSGRVRNATQNSFKLHTWRAAKQLIACTTSVGSSIGQGG